ncbi:MAG TPA: hypothetical protein VJB57_13575 [Dehalococcoidia bacterium]|nr:hypothetical protein [Dehalococcoidia bacterium]
MAPDPEALAQLARLLEVEPSRLADADSIEQAVEAGMERLAEGMLKEIAASDDVSDSDSALDFLDKRLESLGALLNHRQRARLSQALRGKIDAW